MHSHYFLSILTILIWMALFSAGCAGLWTLPTVKKPFVKNHLFWVMLPLSLATSIMLIPLVSSIFFLIAQMDASISNHNVRKGWVIVEHTDGKVNKICDGTTLLYSNGASVPNSIECK
jgi:hypothetical protein